MKKILLFFAFAIMTASAFAQAQIDTKKVKISDFTQKVTKVVLTGSAIYDGVLQDEVAARWRISPYEYCTLDEFNSLKGSDKYYFLITTKGQFKKEAEPSLQFLTLVKGGSNASKGIILGRRPIRKRARVPTGFPDHNSGVHTGLNGQGLQRISRLEQLHLEHFKGKRKEYRVLRERYRSQCGDGRLRQLQRDGRRFC